MCKKSLRTIKGQSTVVLGLVLSVWVILALGLFGFEANRIELAREQLRSACDAASLSAAACLASSNDLNAASAQQTAIDTGLNTFQQNVIIGTSMSSAS